MKTELTIIHGQIRQDELDGRAVFTNRLDSSELLQRLRADRLRKEVHKLAGRLQLATLNPGSRHDQIPCAEGIGTPEERKQRKVPPFGRDVMHRITESAGRNHKTS